MKKLLFTFLLFLPMVVHAQRIDKPNEPYDYFTTLKTSYSYGKTDAYVSFGDKDGLNNLYNDSDKVEKKCFSSFEEALNYMSKRGCVLVERISNSAAFIKKSVTSDKQIYENLILQKEEGKEKE